MYLLELAGQDDAFAACEAESAATGVELVGAGLATARALTDRVDALAFTRRASALVGTTGVDTQRAERALGDRLVDRGFRVDLDDPDHELRALFAGPPGSDGDSDSRVCALGWLTRAVERSFGERRPSDRPFFQPGSMDPIHARALV
ncbi:TIGR01177 family methyltransferase, partial [Halobacteriales archaeon QH_3_68_24]